ncbi:metal-sulfur cluster assembly factor [Xylocopilactobacillus apicola]|nr:metal-sulfur cluster assembly factor [Xylocopilactobacillus apicola]
MNETNEDELLADTVYGQLEDVIDPELGIDIVNLGLIYDVTCFNHQCLITMTLTIMGCPLSEMLSEQIKEQVLAIKEIEECTIKLVWEPAWTTAKMSRYAKLFLGIHD